MRYLVHKAELERILKAEDFDLVALMPGSLPVAEYCLEKGAVGDCYCIFAAQVVAVTPRAVLALFVVTIECLVVQWAALGLVTGPKGYVGCLLL